MKELSIRRERGFTLIELVVVVTIIGLLVGVVGLRYFGRIEPAKQTKAKQQIEIFSTGLQMFYLDVGRYPTTEEGIKALREKPSEAEGWKGPYLEKEIAPDPWGSPYVYKFPGEHGDYDLISYGKDRVEGGEGENQDIVNWKDIEK